MSNPQARKDEIVAQEVFEELVIYDLKRKKVHLLNPTAALVWQHLDGKHTPADLSGLLEQELDVTADELLWLTLEQLDRVHLLAAKPTSPHRHKVITRRQLLKMTGISLALLPVVKSIVAPTVAQAGTGSGLGQSCILDSDCSSGLMCISGTCQ